MRLELWAAPAQSAPRPQGWFLSRVVAPLYSAMRKEMNRKGPRGKSLGHTKKCNYDDFNEFFWQSGCLNYVYYTSDESDRLTPSAAAVLEAFGKAGDGFGRGEPKPEVGLPMAAHPARPACPAPPLVRRPPPLSPSLPLPARPPLPLATADRSRR